MLLLCLSLKHCKFNTKLNGIEHVYNLCGKTRRLVTFSITSLFCTFQKSCKNHHSGVLNIGYRCQRGGGVGEGPRGGVRDPLTYNRFPQNRLKVMGSTQAVVTIPLEALRRSLRGGPHRGPPEAPAGGGLRAGVSFHSSAESEKVRKLTSRKL